MVYTGGVVKAWQTLTLVNIDLTPLSSETIRAPTSEFVYSIHTLPSVQARAASTLIRFHLTILSEVTRKALAFVRVYHVITPSTIYARVAVTFVDLFIAEETKEAFVAETDEPSDRIDTPGVICTRSAGAFIKIHRAISSTESRHTFANKGCYSIMTGSSIPAGFEYYTFIELMLTVLAKESG